MRLPCDLIKRGFFIYLESPPRYCAKPLTNIERKLQNEVRNRATLCWKNHCPVQKDCKRRECNSPRIKLSEPHLIARPVVLQVKYSRRINSLKLQATVIHTTRTGKTCSVSGVERSSGSEVHMNQLAHNNSKAEAQ